MRRLDESPISTILRKRNVTPQQLATRAGVSTRTVERWQHDAVRLHSRTTYWIGLMLELDAAEIRRLTSEQRLYLDAAAARDALEAASVWCKRATQFDATQLQMVSPEHLDALLTELATLKARFVALQASPNRPKVRVMRPRQHIPSDSISIHK